MKFKPNDYADRLPCFKDGHLYEWTLFQMIYLQRTETFDKNELIVKDKELINARQLIKVLEDKYNKAEKEDEDEDSQFKSQISLLTKQITDLNSKNEQRITTCKGLDETIQNLEVNSTKMFFNEDPFFIRINDCYTRLF